MKKYRHLFFDLDNTLWDFASNSAETLAELYSKYKLQELGKLLVRGTAFERRPHDVIVYKSVGIGLEDVALANLVFERVR